MQSSLSNSHELNSLQNSLSCVPCSKSTIGVELNRSGPSLSTLAQEPRVFEEKNSTSLSLRFLLSASALFPFCFPPFTASPVPAAEPPSSSASDSSCVVMASGDSVDDIETWSATLACIACPSRGPQIPSLTAADMADLRRRRASEAYDDSVRIQRRAICLCVGRKGSTLEMQGSTAKANAGKRKRHLGVEVT